MRWTVALTRHTQTSSAGDQESVATASLPRGGDPDRMVISPATAKTHVNRAMAKLHARDRAQLVILAYESGLVAPRGSC